MRVVLLFMLSVLPVRAQVNVNFELGNFSGWHTRAADSIFENLPLTEVIPGRHSITSGVEKDPWTCFVVPKVCPGGSFSAKIGNDAGGHESEAITMRFTVNSAAPVLLYRYAVVLDEPWHPEDQRPGLRVTMTSSEKECYRHRIEMRDSLGPLQTCLIGGKKIRYSNWSAGAMDLTPLAGTHQEVAFRTNDCSLGGHFGYAYIDAEFVAREREIWFCEREPAILDAPEGFSGYQWDGVPGTRVHAVVRAFDGQLVECELLPDFGCPVKLVFRLRKFSPADCRESSFFTPNGDGINDCWLPPTIDPSAKITIFDRRGRQLAQMRYDDCWDGTLGGTDLPPDDYWYMIRSKDGLPAHGHFSLVR